MTHCGQISSWSWESTLAYFSSSSSWATCSVHEINSSRLRLPELSLSSYRHARYSISGSIDLSFSKILSTNFRMSMEAVSWSMFSAKKLAMSLPVLSCTRCKVDFMWMIESLICRGISKSWYLNWIFLSTENEIGSMKTTLPSTQDVLTTKIC